MPAMKLIQSVGIGGANKPEDVKEVQIALNSLLSLIAPTKKLVVKPMGSNLDFIHLLSLCWNY